MRDEMRDARGWYLHEKLRIVAGHWAFRAVDGVVSLAHWLRVPGAPWLHESRICRWLASEGYLYDNLRRGDMPENLRIGGIWR